MVRTTIGSHKTLLPILTINIPKIKEKIVFQHNKKFPHDDGEIIRVSVEPADIDFFNKLLEGYDNMAMVTTVDASLGQLALRVAKSAKKDIMAVLRCMPIPVVFE